MKTLCIKSRCHVKWRNGCVAALILMAVPHVASGHGTRGAVVEKKTMCVFFSYDDDESMSYAKVKIEAPGMELPFQTGATDCNGMICFAPDRDGAWRVSAGDDMGHLQQMVIPVALDTAKSPEQPNQPAQAPATAPQAGSPRDRAGRVVAGVGVIFGLTGLIALWQSRRGRKGPG